MAEREQSYRIAGGIVIVRVNQIKVGSAHQLGPGIAKRLFPSGIHLVQHTVKAQDADHVAGQGHDAAIQNRRRRRSPCVILWCWCDHRWACHGGHVAHPLGGKQVFSDRRAPHGCGLKRHGKCGLKLLFVIGLLQEMRPFQNKASGRVGGFSATSVKYPKVVAQR